MDVNKGPKESFIGVDRLDKEGYHLSAEALKDYGEMSKRAKERLDELVKSSPELKKRLCKLYRIAAGVR